MTTSTISTSSAPSGAGQFFLRYSTAIVFIVIFLYASLSADRFFAPGNLMNILRQSAILGTVACGMLMVILTGGIDLSVGSLLALCSVVTALTIRDYGLAVGITAGILSGAVAGMVTGGLVSLGKMAPFVASLVMMTVARGMALILSSGNPVRISSDSLDNFGTESILQVRFASGLFGITIITIVMLLVVFFTMFVLRKTAFGRIVTAIGSNETAVSHAGIPTRMYIFLVYVFCGTACGIAALIASSRSGVGSPILGMGFELDAIAAVVIGGASLSGGRGTALNTLIGALILGVISNYMNIRGIPGYHQNIVKGVIIALAVLVEGLKNRNTH
jgi:Ribose/xylose/arabinose/galactoside ABC-type transport systems, permease components